MTTHFLFCQGCLDRHFLVIVTPGLATGLRARCWVCRTWGPTHPVRADIAKASVSARGRALERIASQINRLAFHKMGFGEERSLAGETITWQIDDPDVMAPR